jgi:hypothetical protein
LVCCEQWGYPHLQFCWIWLEQRFHANGKLKKSVYFISISILKLIIISTKQTCSYFYVIFETLLIYPKVQNFWLSFWCLACFSAHNFLYLYFFDNGRNFWVQLRTSLRTRYAYHTLGTPSIGLLFEKWQLVQKAKIRSFRSISRSCFCRTARQSEAKI